MTRKELALQHHQEMLKDEESIEYSVNNSSYYANCSADVGIIDSDCLSAAINSYDILANTTILNFASWTQPGGGYLNGAMAQEESLCSESNLYEILNHERFACIYESNKYDKNSGLYRNQVIFTPSVKFIRDGKTYEFNVLTCAAPNYKEAIRNGISDEEIKKVYKDRIRYIYQILENEMQDLLIAGAWGCGVFGNSLDYAIECFKECATTDTILAIPSDPKFKPIKSNV